MWGYSSRTHTPNQSIMQSDHETMGVKRSEPGGQNRVRRSQGQGETSWCHSVITVQRGVVSSAPLALECAHVCACVGFAHQASMPCVAAAHQLCGVDSSSLFAEAFQGHCSAL